MKADGLTRTISIVEVAEALGVALTDHGAHLAGHCPLHSGGGFEIDLASDTWSCATCNLDGGAVELVMALQGISRRHAAELLRVAPLKLSPPLKRGPRWAVSQR